MHEGAVTEVFEDYCLVDTTIYLPNTLIPKVTYPTVQYSVYWYFILGWLLAKNFIQKIIFL